MLNTVIQLVKKKKQVGLFLFSIILAIILTFLLSDTTFTQTQNYVLFLLFFCCMPVDNRSCSSIFGEHYDCRFFSDDHGKK